MRKWVASKRKLEDSVLDKACVFETTCPFCGTTCAVEWVDWREWENGAPSPFKDPELVAFQTCPHFTGEWDWEGEEPEFCFETEEED